MKYIAGFLLLMSWALNNKAQDLSDVYRWSYLGIGGTARSAGLANAMTAVGSDAMSGSINPAGLGLYRKSDLMFTLSLRTGSNNSQYIEQNTPANRFNVALSNFAIAIPLGAENRDGDTWQGAVVSFHLNQVNNFARRTNFSAYNAVNSFCDFYAQEGVRTGVGENTFYGRLGYNSYLIDSAGTANLLPAIAGGKVNQNFERFEAGRMGEYGMGLAGNYAEKFFIGGSVNIVRGVYNREISYSEEVEAGKASYNYIIAQGSGGGYGLTRHTYDDVLKTTATGVNGKIGILIKPNPKFRFGLNFQSPTLLSLNDTYTTEVTADFSTPINNPTFSPLSYSDSIRGKYSYNITTPARLNAGLAVFLAKKGFVTGEIEYVNYVRAYINDANNSFKAVNREISKNFRSVLNVKVAGEMRLDDHFQVRAGFAMLNNPLTQKAREYSSNGGIKTLMGWQPNVTGGIGYRDEEYYFDLVGVYSYTQEKYYPYITNDTPSPLAISKYSLVQLFFTLGFRF